MHIDMPKLTLITDNVILKGLSSAMDADNILETESVDIEIDSDTDSLFDEPMAESPYDNLHEITPVTYTEPPPPQDRTPARRTAPPVPGLFFDPSSLLPDDTAEELLQTCIDQYFQEKNVNQVMLFERVTKNVEGVYKSGGPYHELNTILRYQKYLAQWPRAQAYRRS
jgi:hypothetical protein